MERLDIRSYRSIVIDNGQTLVGHSPPNGSSKSLENSLDLEEAGVHQANQVLTVEMEKLTARKRRTWPKFLSILDVVLSNPGTLVPPTPSFPPL